jgi:hypothetical protein
VRTNSGAQLPHLGDQLLPRHFFDVFVHATPTSDQKHTMQIGRAGKVFYRAV